MANKTTLCTKELEKFLPKGFLAACKKMKESCYLQQLYTKLAAAAAAAAVPEVTSPTPKGPPPLLRSRTLPAIVVPGINILHAQIDSKYKSAEDSCSSGVGDKYNLTKFNVCPPSSENTLLDPRRHLIHHRLSSPEPSQGMMDAMLRLPSPSCNNTPRLSTCSASGTTTTALYRLAKLLNQKEPSQPRRLSWETDGEELSCIPRSSSIDSMVESKNCSPLSRRLPSPLLVRTPPSGLPPPLSPSVGRRMKGQRALTVATARSPFQQAVVSITDHALCFAIANINS
ncbi:hypothetical protein LSTR_LSTR003265 [Laodelphax striatellus]|uniref:Uncharacterized protein n=1 Tax=Laodelphax striatellus TaxID=195883 RepID=A0A482XRV7_LAOST|nr:hypothetical protein LSTR_LSTR003265 [Laodelphax striatellus]